MVLSFSLSFLFWKKKKSIDNDFYEPPKVLSPQDSPQTISRRGPSRAIDTSMTQNTERPKTLKKKANPLLTRIFVIIGILILIILFLFSFGLNNSLRSLISSKQNK